MKYSKVYLNAIIKWNKKQVAIILLIAAMNNVITYYPTVNISKL